MNLCPGLQHQHHPPLFHAFHTDRDLLEFSVTVTSPATEAHIRFANCHIIATINEVAARPLPSLVLKYQSWLKAHGFSSVDLS